jgi:hypothetical protein
MGAGAVLALGALATLLAAVGAQLVALASAPAASLGSLSISSSTGTDTTGNIELTASAACPAAATNVYVTIAGAGFPAGANAVGNAEISIYSTAPSGGLIVPLGLTWDALARSQGTPVPLSGTATLTMICTDTFASANLGDFGAKVRFTPTGSSGSNYAVVGGKPRRSPTPTPTPTSSDSPRPTDSAPPTGTSTPAPSSTASSGSAASSAPASASAGKPPHTGTDVAAPVSVGLALLLIGGAMMVIRRLRRLRKRLTFGEPGTDGQPEVSRS